jgi:hypothetical protein
MATLKSTGLSEDNPLHRPGESEMAFWYRIHIAGEYDDNRVFRFSTTDANLNVIWKIWSPPWRSQRISMSLSGIGPHAVPESLLFPALMELPTMVADLQWLDTPDPAVVEEQRIISNASPA